MECNKAEHAVYNIFLISLGVFVERVLSKSPELSK